jgi:hypothetical protein
MSGLVSTVLPLPTKPTWNRIPQTCDTHLLQTCVKVEGTNYLIIMLVNLTDTNYWIDITGSDAVTNLSITIDPAQTNVFYRIRKP